CEPDDRSRPRQADLDQPAPRGGACLQRHAPCRTVVGLPTPVLARVSPRAAPWADRRGSGHGLRRASPHPVLARGNPWRAECLVLLADTQNAGTEATSRG